VKETGRFVISETLRIHKINYVKILGSKKYIGKHVCWLKTLYHVSGVHVCVCVCVATSLFLYNRRELSIYYYNGYWAILFLLPPSMDFFLYIKPCIISLLRHRCTMPVNKPLLRRALSHNNVSTPG